MSIEKEIADVQKNEEFKVNQTICRPLINEFKGSTLNNYSFFNANENDLVNDLIDKLFLKLKDGYIIAKIPIELLFTESFETAKTKADNITEAWITQNAIWQDLNLIRLKPHRELMYFFLNGLSDLPNNYLKWYENIFISRDLNPPLSSVEIIDKRYSEFRFMTNELNKGMNFFYEYPSIIQWNDERKYFNLLDGHHRAMFLFSHGIRQIPCQMPINDYIKYINIQCAKETNRIILDQNRKEFYTPIPHPYFIDRVSYRDMCGKTRLDHILEFFNEYRFEGFEIIDIGANLCYFSQHFEREGAFVTSLEPCDIHFELANSLNNLFYSKINLIKCNIQDLNIDKKYDVCIFLSVFYHLFKSPLRKKIIEIVDNITSKFIFWESGELNNCEEEKNYILENTKFKCYKKLAYSYGTGKVRELGVFYKNSY